MPSSRWAGATDASEVAALPGLARVVSLSGSAWSIVAFTIVAFLLRVFLIGTPPLWRDEAFSAVAARLPVVAMLDGIRHDSAPPLSFLLLKVVRVLSESEGSLRMVSVLAGTAMVPVAAALGRRMGGARAAVFAAATMALMPAYIVQARDLRMYALASALVLASCLSLWRALEHSSRSRLLVLSACVAMAVYTQYFAVLAIGAQLVVAAAVLRPPRPALVRAGLATAAGMATLIPWLIAAIPQFQHAGAPFWITAPDFNTITDLFATFVGGYRRYGPLGELLTNLRMVATAGAAVGALAAAVQVVRNPGARRALAYPAGGALLALAVLLLVSLWRPLYDARYAAVVWVPLVPVVGAGLGWLSSRLRPTGAVLAAASLLALGVCGVVLGPNTGNDDLRPAVAGLAGRVQPGDFVAVDGALHYFTVMYYGDAGVRQNAHVVSPSVRWFDGTSLYGPDTWVTTVPAATPGRVFVITASTAPYQSIPPDYSLRDVSCSSGFCIQTWSR